MLTVHYPVSKILPFLSLEKSRQYLLTNLAFLRRVASASLALVPKEVILLKDA